MEKEQTLSLDLVRADGWFERFAQVSPQFDQLCEIVGRSFVAFSILAGVRITSVVVDKRMPDASVVEFSIGEKDTTIHRLALAEFRRRLISALLSQDADESSTPIDESPESIQSFIGFRYVLLAPVFGIKLLELSLRDEGEPMLFLEENHVTTQMSVHQFQSEIRARIEKENPATAPGSAFSINLGAIPEAEIALGEEDWEKIIELLGAWPGPLSILLRTAEGQQLGMEARNQLARALGFLGRAYAKTGRAEFAEDVMRLGIQWAQVGETAAELFQRLGETYVTSGRHAEAIGFFRRALALGANKKNVLPLLAHCYNVRKRHVAAMACIDEATAAGVDPKEVQAVRDEAAGVLNPHWDALHSFLTSK